MTASAKSLILDLLSTMPARYPVPVGALVRAARVLGIGENSARVALTRLRARGLVESDTRGLYRLGASARAVNRHVRSWRSVEESVVPWDGSWVGVELAGRRRADRRLRLLGLRELAGRLLVRPDNLSGGVAGVRRRVESLGIDTGCLVFGLSQLDAECERRARGLWDAPALERAYARHCETLAASTVRLPTLSREMAMAESFRVGGEAVRQIATDPLLPSPIIDTEKRRALVDAMRRYDELGRSFWRAWAGEAVELERSPGDLSGLATARDAYATAETH